MILRCALRKVLKPKTGQSGLASCCLADLEARGLKFLASVKEFHLCLAEIDGQKLANHLGRSTLKDAQRQGPLPASRRGRLAPRDQHREVAPRKFCYQSRVPARSARREQLETSAPAAAPTRGPHYVSVFRARVAREIGAKLQHCRLDENADFLSHLLHPFSILWHLCIWLILSCALSHSKCSRWVPCRC